MAPAKNTIIFGPPRYKSHKYTSETTHRKILNAKATNEIRKIHNGKCTSRNENRKIKHEDTVQFGRVRIGETIRGIKVEKVQIEYVKSVNINRTNEFVKFKAGIKKS